MLIAISDHAIYAMLLGDKNIFLNSRLGGVRRVGHTYYTTVAWKSIKSAPCNCNFVLSHVAVRTTRRSAGESRSEAQGNRSFGAP